MARKASPTNRPREPIQSRRAVLLIVVVVCVLGSVLWLRPDAPISYWWGKSLVDRDPAKAEELLQWSIIARQGDYPQAQLALTTILATQEQWNEALGAFSLIQETSECDVAELLALAEICEGGGFPLLAEKSLLAANRPGPNQPEVLRRLLILQVRLGRLSELSLELANELVEVDPSDDLPWRIRGQIHELRREILPAIADYEQALQLEDRSSESTATRVSLIGLHIRMGDAAAARGEFDKLPTENRHASEVRLSEAWLHRLEGDSERGLSLADSVATDHPESQAARFARGVMRLDAGQIDAAINDLQWCVERDSENLEARYKLGQALQQAGRAAEAGRHLERARQIEAARIRALGKN